MNILKKLMGAAAATLLLVAIAPTSANALYVLPTEYPFSALCDDCTSGTAGWTDGTYVPVSGTLSLHGYTPGTMLGLGHFHSFTYDGSSILPMFTVTATYATSLSGVLDAAGHVTSDFSLTWSDTGTSLGCVGGTCELFVPTESAVALWSIGTLSSPDLDDVGIMGTFASVPEPGTLALFGLGLAGLGFARRRKAA